MILDGDRARRRSPSPASIIVLASIGSTEYASMTRMSMPSDFELIVRLQRLEHRHARADHRGRIVRRSAARPSSRRSGTTRRGRRSLASSAATSACTPCPRRAISTTRRSVLTASQGYSTAHPCTRTHHRQDLRAPSATARPHRSTRRRAIRRTYVGERDRAHADEIGRARQEARERRRETESRRARRAPSPRRPSPARR